MSNAPADALSLAQELIRCESVTPDEGGALDLLEGILAAAGFTCTRLTFSDTDTPDIDNLFARIGTGSPHLCFAGHTDVVPPGDESLWRHPPFAATIEDGILYGRGASDMKGGIAAFASAAIGLLAEAAPQGSISLLITGDEEGPAINGTVKVLDWMKANGHLPDHAIVGEPTNRTALGQEIKIGRRGSLSGRLRVSGRQGHTAYPELASDPVAGLVAALGALLDEPLDEGSEHFGPSNLQVTSIDTGNPAANVIPEAIEARFNVRFNDRHDPASLKDLIKARIAPALDKRGLAHELGYETPSPCFLTEPGELSALMCDAVAEITGKTPALTTTGGTSDARFIKDHCPLVEFGLTNDTIHQTDECVALADLEALTAIYGDFLRRYFKAFA